MATIEFRAMGCKILARVDSSSPQIRQRLQQAPAWFEAWEQTFSRFRPDSELSLVNQSGGQPVQVSRDFAEVLEIAVSMEKASLGLVTPVVLEALVLAGYERSFELLPESGRAEEAGASIYSRLGEQIDWQPASRTLRLPAGMRLDFGGIVKGWAAQQAARRLGVYGAALVSAGGDIAISALQNDGQTWPVAVEDPFDPENRLAMLALGRCGVATSGRDYRRWQQNGDWKHHIIDPRTGEPAVTDILTATVVAPAVIDAEMAAKKTLILGSQAGLAWLEAQNNLACLLVLEDGRRIDSQKMIKYLGNSHGYKITN